MINPAKFVKTLQNAGVNFYAGVPDSLLASLCAYLQDNAKPQNNITAANEGGAIGLAAGFHLATGKVGVVYMQNSGIGNAVNPLLSLTDKAVYNIPVLLIIGWRGEPGVKDEPQHVTQGRLTLPLLESMGIANEILTEDESKLDEQIHHAMSYIKTNNEAFALVVRKGTFEKYALKENDDEQKNITYTREDAINTILDFVGKRDCTVSTTGKISRELYELRDARGEGHDNDFLTVGSMGHASQIATGLALNLPTDRRVFCLDGDGASIMHMGNMGIVGQLKPANLIHFVLNNGAHDSVGGQPTIGLKIDFLAIAKAVGYQKVYSVDTANALRETLTQALNEPKTTSFIEVKVRKGSRDDLGRPKTSAIDNKKGFMQQIARNK